MENFAEVIQLRGPRPFLLEAPGANKASFELQIIKISSSFAGFS